MQREYKGARVTKMLVWGWMRRGCGCAGHVGGTCGSGIVSTAVDVLWMSVVRWLKGVGSVCVWLGWRGWMRGLGLGFTNDVGTWGVLDVCLCLGGGGVGGVCLCRSW